MENRFEIEITGTEHHTWQGILHTQEGAAPFRSELELLLALKRQLSRPEARPPYVGKGPNPIK